MDKILADLAKVVETGKIRSYGVSNFTQHHLVDMYNAGLKVPYNQVEFHPYLYQKQLLEFCRKNGTKLVSYRTLGKGELVKEFVFAEIGDKYGKTPAQVILRWVIQQGIPVIPKASGEQHLKENFNIFDFELTEAEVLKINGLNRNLRYCKTEGNEFDY
jgi:diketogulonate reductase-like aldo/keto reductase